MNLGGQYNAHLGGLGINSGGPGTFFRCTSDALAFFFLFDDHEMTIAINETHVSIHSHVSCMFQLKALKVTYLVQKGQLLQITLALKC